MPVARLEFRRAALASFACAAIHIVAGMLMLLLLRPGLPLFPVGERAAYLAEHAAAWRVGWASWIAGTTPRLVIACTAGSIASAWPSFQRPESQGVIRPTA